VPPRVAAVRPELPRDLDRIVSRCLEKDPRDRFQTARDVFNELRYLSREVDRAGGAAASSEAPHGSAPPSAAPRSEFPAPPPSAPPAYMPPASSSAPPSSGVREGAPSIAVLPFVNRSRDEEDEYFSDGLTDELLNVLAKIRGLRVSARTSAFQFKGKNEDLAVIGQKLNVATLLEGTVRRSGNRVRITVQLVKVADGFQLWSETYDRTLDDIFAVQDDIAQSVVKELRAALLGEAPDSKASGEVRAEVAAAAKGRGENAEAHRLFLQGRFLVNRLAAKDLAHGIALLRQALSIEPGHALAWAWLSWAETTAAVTTSSGLEGGIARAREAAGRAMEIEPGLAESHLAMGSLQLWYDFDWKGADASNRRALELAPGSAVAMRANAMMSHILERYDDALSLCRRSLEQDPLSASAYGIIARVYLATEKLPEAEAAFRKGLEISSDATSFHSLLSIVLDAQGRREEALDMAMKEPAEWARYFALAVVHFTGGRPEDSKRALDDLVRIGAESAAYQIAVVHAARGEVDEAFEWLERAFTQRDSGLAFIRGHWILRPLHGDPRWHPFVKKLGFPD
jgi:TolB-like protein